jgi:competence protein ComEC
VFPGLASVLSWVASLGAWLITQIASYFASAPVSTLKWPIGLEGILLSIAVAGAVFAFLKSKLSRLRVLSSLALGLVAASVLGSCTGQQFQARTWLPSTWTIVSCDVGQGDATVIRSHGQVALVDVGRKPGPIRSCLHRLGINHLNLLVLTHFDLDHVGGLDGALDSATIDTALITSYQDERPAAFITYRKLRAASQRLIQVGAGLTGVLGDFKWRVLSPHQGAAEAEDSNDGSVTMLFQSANMNVLTLADLGEKGQMRLASESATWLGNGFGGVPLVVKVSHHGSADQYPELYEALKPQIGLFSVGAHNDYGHPTKRTLDLLVRVGAQVYRTDLQGSIAVESTAEGLRVSTSGQG